ncbi:protein translocase subunit SecDF [Metabacillus litoralis]|uniref:protein translocase subunit SecDF n=1 Tax=Metabacillus litoralis TaxID=152268 RepID=UPI00203DEEBC|nr:protein translocase subunit SecDF [Metabacillus litoralis]MCM3164993.1 protein translocase subunit SecDF [Metabacillus litoralis]MCM3413088.1 protein translocase subunit SecDF [Metabacillus litoralis]
MVKRGRIIAFFLLVLVVGSIIGLNTNRATSNIILGLDLQGGFEILYEVEPANKGDKITRDVLVSTVNALQKRANVLGVSEPNIQIEGEDRIRVQLAGVSDQNKAREILSTQAELTFRDYEDKEMLNGSDLVEGGAKQSFDEQGKPNVAIKLKDATKFKEVTEEIVGNAPYNQLVIWLDYEEGDSFQEEATKQDPKYLSAPNVDQVFNQTDVTITGNFTIQEAQDLANLLNAGSLPVKLTEMYSTSVGAQFGEQALDQTVLAGIVGIAIIFLFMLFFYRLPGFIAVITLSTYIYLILQVFDWMNGVLTLPGIAALILGVGMAVDANIITYERIKEELKLGRTVRSAFKAGTRRSFTTIFDANITTILAGAVLFFFGTSSVKGFATMLIISIIVSFLTAVFLSRILLALLVESRWLDKKKGYFGVKKEHIISIEETDDDTIAPTRFDNVDFLKHRKKFFMLSTILVIVGIVILVVFRLNLGIDFASGTRVEVQADKSLTTQEVNDEMEKLGLEADDVVLAGNNNEIGVARFIGVLDQQKIAEVKSHFKELYGMDPNVSTVSPTVGKELARNAMYGILIASIGIIIYVAIRFEFYMALASIVALLHDAFFIIAFFSITRLEVDITFIAAVLTIVGYSINDTIVTFDRIRELYKKKKVKTVDDLKLIVNRSLQQTFTRSVNTVLTVVIAVVALMIFGSTSITNFSIALLVGLVSGTYSSLFIAAQLWLIWKGKQLTKKKDVPSQVSDEPQV